MRETGEPARGGWQGIKAKSEYRLPARPETVGTEKFREAEFNAMFEEYTFRAHLAAGSPQPKREGWKWTDSGIFTWRCLCALRGGLGERSFKAGREREGSGFCNIAHWLILFGSPLRFGKCTVLGKECC